MEKRLARHKGYKNVYVHNDLAGAAYHFKQTIELNLPQMTGKASRSIIWLAW